VSVKKVDEVGHCFFLCFVFSILQYRLFGVKCLRRFFFVFFLLVFPLDYATIIPKDSDLSILNKCFFEIFFFGTVYALGSDVSR
jgi:hypothetical protein